MKPDVSGAAIGIDLGTTHSCVGVWRNNRVEIVPNQQGNRITPSYISFTSRERLFGEEAKQQAETNPHNTVFNTKRLLGWKFDDPVVQNHIQWYPFTVTTDRDRPVITVESRGEIKEFPAEEIASMIIHTLKESAEAYLGHSVTHAVITCPTWFNHAQRQATKDAGTIAGLHVLRDIDEPTAAAIAFGFNIRQTGEQNILIYDLGSGSLSVTLVTLDEGIYEVKATSGNPHLGGEDFDNRILDHFVQDFGRRHKKDLWMKARAIRRLRTACERAKCSLSSIAQTRIEVDSLFEDIDFSAAFSRTQFEELCEDLFQLALEPVKEVLRLSKIPKGDVHEVVIVGGASRMPRIIKLLSEYFDGKEVSRSVNADEAAAFGAAVQATILSGNAPPLLQDLLLLDAAPYTTGVRFQSGRMAAILNRCSTLPTKKSEIFYTESDDETSVKLDVYEGNQEWPSGPNMLGTLVLPMPPGAKGRPYEVAFDCDAFWNIEVTARDQESGTSATIKLARNRDCLSEEEIDRMVVDAKRYKEEDDAAAARNTARNELESYAYQLREPLTSSTISRKLTPADVERLTKAFDDTMNWFEESQEASKEEYDLRRTKLERLANPILRKLQ